MNRSTRFDRSRGFSRVELIALILAFVMGVALALPALNNTRYNARGMTCRDRLGELAQAAQLYAADFDDRFFYHWPNYNTAPDGTPGHVAGWWYDTQRIGPYLPDTKRAPLNVFHFTTRNLSGYLSEREALANKPSYKHYRHLKELVGGVMVCPTQPDFVDRSYVMNFWASGVGPHDYIKKTTSHAVFSAEHGSGEFFNQASPDLDMLLLFTESFVDPVTRRPTATDWFGTGQPPFYRFAGQRTANGKLLRMMVPTPDGNHRLHKSWVLDYGRHTPNANPDNPKPEGQVNMAFADGHVATVGHGELYDLDKQRSTYNVLWSHIDRDVDDEFISKDTGRQLGQ